MLRHELNRRGHFLLRNDGLTALCKAGIEAMADIEACFNESGVNFTEGALRQAFKDERGCLRIVSLNNTNPKLLASLCKIMVSRRLASRSDNGLGINLASPAGFAWFRGIPVIAGLCHGATTIAKSVTPGGRTKWAALSKNVNSLRRWKRLK
jgi:hypothetical protein